MEIAASDAIAISVQSKQAANVTMRWVKSSLDSLNSMFEQAVPRKRPKVDLRIEDVRAAMLASALAADLADLADHRSLIRRMSFTNDLHELWFIRSELMTAMAFKCGEHRAQQEIAAISKMFDQLLPEARGYKYIARRFRVVGTGSTVRKHPTP